LCKFGHGVFGALALFGGEFADGGEKGGVDGASVEKERTENFKDASLVGSVKCGGGVGKEGKLCFGAESGLLPWVRGMFWLCGRWMLEPV
jgi:hypothetical protein